mmetsp:Transcript_22594/g.89424  ORF Transcript_22594/g.89424 Transcript_22594/m.89424 type:complete len:204 (+) Transcript_22594:1553-2164(+)
MMYCTRFVMAPSCSTARSRSKTPLKPCGDSSCSTLPTSFTKPTATSTLSSVGRSSRSARICSARISPATCWLTRCAMKVVVAMRLVLSFLLYALRSCTMRRASSSSPTCGILVFTTAMSAAKTRVNVGDTCWAFMSALQRRPRPRMMFSRKSSSIRFMMLLVFTLLIRPLMLLRSASQVIRWYSAELLSAVCCCSCASRNGGM